MEHKRFDFRKDISTLFIEANRDGKNCGIRDEENNYYNDFILIQKKTVSTICNVQFHRSSATEKYLPRFVFTIENIKDKTVKTTNKNKVRIEIGEVEALNNFWKMIDFIQRFKNLVDTGDFKSKYRVVNINGYLVDFKEKETADKVNEIIELANHTELSELNIKTLAFIQRRKTICEFYLLLNNLPINGCNSPFDHYKNKHEIKKNGEEAVWQHFLKNHKWILGLNVNLVFIKDLLLEKNLGSEDTGGKGSSKTDFIGLNYFTTLIELKTAKTKLFKETKSSKSRANTFDFSNDFIEAYSQTLAQREDAIANKKKQLNDGDKELDRSIYRTMNPKCILILGYRNKEFPHERSQEKNMKSDTFERFRNSVKNIDIITYDELFERAYHIVFSKILEIEWQNISPENFSKTYLQ